MKYDRVELKELCSLSQGLQIPIASRFREDGENRYFYITVQFLKDSSDKYFIENPPERVKCNSNDILVVRTGNTGQIITGVEGCFHNNFFKVEPNEKIYSKFLYYTLKSPELYTRMRNVASGTTILDLKHSAFLGLDIYLPDINNQKKIAYILEIIDQKIKICEEINKNLTEISTRQFSHLMNNNIEEYLELKDICKFIKGRKPKEVSEQYKSNFSNYLTIEVLSNQNHTYAYDEKGIIANEYDILMVMDGASSGKLFYGKQGLVGSTLAKIDVNKEYLEIIYQFLKFNEKYISDNTTGSAIPHTDKGLVLNLKCPISKKLLGYSEFFKSIRSSIILNNNEIIKLQKLRDTLLPKLMSGEIDVSEINYNLNNQSRS